MDKFVRSHFVWLVVILALAIPLLSVAAHDVYPEVIPLKDGFQPEGIAVGYGHTFYTGSLNGGAIFRGDLRSTEVEMIADTSDDKMAVGMDFDERSGLLFVAGGFFGEAYVYDGESGDMVERYELTDPGISFVNDVIVTRTAAYFTDSFQKQLYRLPLGPQGALPEQDDVATVPLGDGFDFDGSPGFFNANGIVASQDGSKLVVVNAGFGKLYKIDPMNGDASEISGVVVPSGDGLVINGRTVYVVQNFLNQIAVVNLAADFESGVVEDEVLTSDAFRIPTTAALFGNALYAVNARFDEVPPGSPDPADTFEAVRVPIPGPLQ